MSQGPAARGGARSHLFHVVPTKERDLLRREQAARLTACHNSRKTQIVNAHAEATLGKNTGRLQPTGPTHAKSRENLTNLALNTRLRRRHCPEPRPFATQFALTDGIGRFQARRAARNAEQRTLSSPAHGKLHGVPKRWGSGPPAPMCGRQASLQRARHRGTAPLRPNTAAGTAERSGRGSRTSIHARNPLYYCLNPMRPLNPQQIRLAGGPSMSRGQSARPEPIC